MTEFNDQPIPLIDAQRCDGCGLCVRACPTHTLEVWDGRAVVANPLECEYMGMCEAACPRRAITRPFEVVLVEEERV